MDVQGRLKLVRRSGRRPWCGKLPVTMMDSGMVLRRTSRNIVPVRKWKQREAAKEDQIKSRVGSNCGRIADNLRA